MQNRRLLQGFSVAVLGFGLACAPMTLASAHNQPKKHHKAPKHHTSKPTFTTGSADMQELPQHGEQLERACLRRWRRPWRTWGAASPG